MKKSFPLHAPRKADARVLDAIKHEVRKYVKRERRKPLPEPGAEWTFECRAGPDLAAAKPSALKDISAAIDHIAKSGVDHLYIEIIAVPAARKR
ncbi:MAG: DUF6172 family protein [Opitutaceae bacterium]